VLAGVANRCELVVDDNEQRVWFCLPNHTVRRIRREFQHQTSGNSRFLMFRQDTHCEIQNAFHDL
jgi:hypothetical protein